MRANEIVVKMFRTILKMLQQIIMNDVQYPSTLCSMAHTQFNIVLKQILFDKNDNAAQM